MTRCRLSENGSPATQLAKNFCVIKSQVREAARKLAHAPATVVRRQNRPSQKAIPINGAIFSQTFSASTTSRISTANRTPPTTTTTPEMRPTQT